MRAVQSELVSSLSASPPSELPGLSVPLVKVVGERRVAWRHSYAVTTATRRRAMVNRTAATTSATALSARMAFVVLTGEMKKRSRWGQVQKMGEMEGETSKEIDEEGVL